jgi:Replication initiator protein A
MITLDQPVADTIPAYPLLAELAVAQGCSLEAAAEVTLVRCCELDPAEARQSVRETWWLHAAERSLHAERASQAGGPVGEEAPSALSRTRGVLPILPAFRGRLENNHARKATFSLDPNRGPSAVTRQSTDMLGEITVDSPDGELSGFDMELTMWLLGKWTPGGQTVVFSKRRCTREFGASWSGQRGDFLDKSLDRIARTRFIGRVWMKRGGWRRRSNVGLIDRWEVVEKADTLDGPASSDGVVTVTLSSFVVEQLEDRQFVEVEWDIFRGKLTKPLTRRLYVLLESHEGQEHGTRYSTALDAAFGATMGSRLAVTNPSRWRTHLRTAAKEICDNDPRYQSIEILPGEKWGQWQLTATRLATDAAHRARQGARQHVVAEQRALPLV